MMTFQDFKYALRLLAKKPGFTFLTIMVMTVGIGMSIYLFSFLHTMAFKPLPFKDAENLITIDRMQNGLYYNGGSLDLHDFYEIRNSVKGFNEVSTYNEISTNISFKDGARRYSATMVEPNFFQISRTLPLLGREFTEADDQVGADPVTIIGYDLWQNHFGGDPDVLEENLRINGVSTRIIGVMPEGYFFPRISDLWLPLQQDVTQIARGDGLAIGGLAILKEGTSIDEINHEIALVMKRLENEYPETNTHIGAYGTTFPMSTIGADSSAFLSSMYIVAILLLILASINVGNLLLSSAIERGKETAIRVALGAPRKRLIGQMLWESIIICTVGSIIGLLLAAWGLEVTESITDTFTNDKPFFWWKFGIDLFTMKIFALFLIATILLTGLLPAIKNTGADFNEVLRDGTRGAQGKKASKLNKILVISEVFLSITVLITAGVMVTGTYFATQADYGAKADDILVANVRMTQENYGTPELRLQFSKELERRLEENNSFEFAAIASDLPGEFAWRPTIAIEGKEYVGDNSYPRANFITYMPGALKKLGVRLIEGRYFEAIDDGLDKRTVIVTESFAKQHFGAESPIGKRIRNVNAGTDEPLWLTIVGVVAHTIQGQPLGQNQYVPSVFRPNTQAPRFVLQIAMKLNVNQTIAVRNLREVMESIDPDIPAYLIKPYEEVVAQRTAGIGFASKVFFAFALVSVLLAASGIYGVMSNSINQRTQEIGVKRALGANDKRIMNDFIKAGLKQLLWGSIPGMLIGCGLGFGLSQLLTIGSAVLIVVTVLMLTVVASTLIFATWIPTKRALQLEPAEALHYE